MEDVTPAAFRVVLGAAYKKAKERGLEKKEIDVAFKQLFWTKSEHYQTAYDCVVKEGRQGQGGTMTGSQQLWDLMEKAIEIVNGIDVAAQNRADSTVQTDYDQLYSVAMDAFSQLVKEYFSFTQEQMSYLVNQIFQPARTLGERLLRSM